MKPPDFAYHRPSTIDEALDQLGEFGGDGKVLAGGQSLVPLLALRLARPEHVIDIGRIAPLAAITEDEGGLLMGAVTNLRLARAIVGEIGGQMVLQTVGRGYGRKERKAKLHCAG